MNRGAWAGLVALLALLAGCHFWTGHGGKPRPVKEPADNSRCHVCHANYEEEKLAVTHAKQGVGCAQCHGTCDAHCGDENNVTPPERLYARDVIISSCMACHPKDDLAEKAEHKPLLANPAAAEKVCTDCHGTHRLARRTVRWDKKTGQLLPKP